MLTKEVLVFRGTHPWLSQFYLMWALSLCSVRDQWNRIVFMQTNREDVGNRFLEINIPYPKSEAVAIDKGRPFKTYLQSLRRVKADLRSSLEKSGEDFHLFFA